MATTHPVNALDVLPAEIWEHIFTFACMDGGYTGRSLALVSTQCSHLSRSTRYHSLVLTRASQFVQLAIRLRNADGPHSIGKIHHLFLTLGNLFYDLAESDEEEDDDYEFSGTEDSSLTSRDEDDSVKANSDNEEGPEGLKQLESSISSNGEDDEAQALEDINTDIEWFHSAEGHIKTSMITDLELPGHATIFQEYRSRESECLELLFEVLSSPSCSDSLESLAIHVDFRPGLPLLDSFPRLPNLQRLTIHSRSSILWGNFLSNSSSATSGEQDYQVRTTAYLSSLRTLRFSGMWSALWGRARAWVDNLLSFIRLHAPQLEKLRAPMPYFISSIEKFLDPKLFPPTTTLALMELPKYPGRIFGTNDLDETLANRYGKEAIEQLNNRIRLIAGSDDDLDIWVYHWKQEINGREGSWANRTLFILGQLE